MSIAFESRDELEELRKRLSRMSDEQLVRFGKAARRAGFMKRVQKPAMKRSPARRLGALRARNGTPPMLSWLPRDVCVELTSSAVLPPLNAC
jgi:hypothetical protein